MSFREYLISDVILDIEDELKEDALYTVAKRMCKKAKIVKYKSVVEDILRREETVSSFVGQGVAIPRVCAQIETDFAIIVARNTEGINYDAARNAKANILVMVFVNKNVDENKVIELTADIATFFKDPIINNILKNEEADTISELFPSSPEYESSENKVRKEPILSSASALAREINAKAILIFADVKQDMEFLKNIRTRKQIIIVTGNKSRFADKITDYDLVQAPVSKVGGIGQVKIGILLALSRNLISREDVVVCVAGTFGKDVFNLISVVDIDKEFDFFFTHTRSLTPPDVKPEVLERVLGIATEIGVDGREGKSVGTIFVLGDTENVNSYIKQLIINPFKGYKKSERNVLDPAIEETIKEFSAIDGAFIISGDGIVVSAGSYLNPSFPNIGMIPELLSGLGTRHAAGAGITVCTNAIAIVISESNGQVTVFKNGSVVLTLSKQNGL
ncbi:MAG: diadenylate cyclase [Chitinispirillales bacterium]|jgi:DNA integrity scanning protein DisA with diadenylate cyclase activity/mannitol/fructose-specific phosphotransferase system IIA component (Ntr-type)|nr:diadenylate cyclase [Chitinispirillales bacterium]